MDFRGAVMEDVIKPSRSTPPHLRTHKLSLFDQLCPGIYIPVLLCYRDPSPAIPQNALIEISSKIKSSLSKTLALYYPFAGRMKDAVSVDCNDEGAVFAEAHIGKKLDDLLQEPMSALLKSLFPDDLPWNRIRNSTGVLGIRLSFFACGGFTIGLCISHKVTDGCSIFTFLNDWATIARNSDAFSVSPPQFIASSVFPPKHELIIPEAEMVEADVVTKRFVFTPSKISALKARIISEAPETPTPTRVQSVTALIYKHAHNASTATASGTIQNPSTVLAQTVNMRRKMVPPLPNNSIGNIVWYFNIMINDVGDVNLGLLMRQMSDGLDSVCRFGNEMRGDRLFLVLSQVAANSKIQHDAYKCSSWCRFSAYDVDFGFGKPVWVGTYDYPYRNNIVLLDTKCGQGIEAWVTLDKQVMAVLEADAKFLDFAALNPSIVVE